MVLNHPPEYFHKKGLRVIFCIFLCPFLCVPCCMFLRVAVKGGRKKKITAIKDGIVCATPHPLIKERRKYEYHIDFDLQTEKVTAV